MNCGNYCHWKSTSRHLLAPIYFRTVFLASPVRLGLDYIGVLAKSLATFIWKIPLLWLPIAITFPPGLKTLHSLFGNMALWPLFAILDMGNRFMHSSRTNSTSLHLPFSNQYLLLLQYYYTTTIVPTVSTCIIRLFATMTSRFLCWRILLNCDLSLYVWADASQWKNYLFLLTSFAASKPIMGSRFFHWNYFHSVAMSPNFDITSVLAAFSSFVLKKQRLNYLLFNFNLIGWLVIFILEL